MCEIFIITQLDHLRKQPKKTIFISWSLKVWWVWSSDTLPGMLIDFVCLFFCRVENYVGKSVNFPWSLSGKFHWKTSLPKRKYKKKNFCWYNDQHSGAIKKSGTLQKKMYSTHIPFTLPFAKKIFLFLFTVINLFVINKRWIIAFQNNRI